MGSYKEKSTGEKLQKLERLIREIDPYEAANPFDYEACLITIFDILKDLEIRAPRFLRA